MADKLVVTNDSALTRKYGAAKSQIDSAFAALVAADKARGITTSRLDLDDAAAMAALGASPVVNALDPRQNKDAIDAAFRKKSPEYLMILGAIDVVPHQDVANPAVSTADPDAYAYGDLPYACENAYSTKADDFVGPTRVVGRLPDVTNGTEPSYLVTLLQNAASAISRPASDYQSYLGFGADVWQKSTALSLQNAFGSSSDAKICPPSGPNWLTPPPPLLGRRSHFINCHGAPADYRFYGQQGTSYPVAHDAQQIAGKITAGTVVAPECCYGAELYDPALANGQMGICNTYLQSGAYGYFGSSTIAYGPEDSNGWADLICQFFFRRLLAGASLGRAVLEARQDFIRAAPAMDPYDLKTLAQYSLMGDPSLQPVQAAQQPFAIPRVAGAAAFLAGATGTTLRRDQLMRFGLVLPSVTSRVVVGSRRPPTAMMTTQLQALAKSAGLANPQLASFDVQNPVLAGFTTAKFSATRPTAIHTAVTSSRPAGAPMQQIAGLVALEENQNIISVRKFFSR